MPEKVQPREEEEKGVAAPLRGDTPAPAQKTGRRGWFWIAVLTSSILVLIVVVGVVLLLHPFQRNERPPALQQPPVVNIEEEKANILVVLKGFLLDLKAENNQTRLVSCDLGLIFTQEGETDSPVQAEDSFKQNVELRKVIYRELRKADREMINTPEGREIIAAALVKEINNLFGRRLCRGISWEKVTFF